MLDGSLLNNGYVYATDSLYFLHTSQVLTNGWQYQLQGDVGLLNGYAGGSFVNQGSGSLVKTAGTGTSLVNITSQHKSGSLVEAKAGRLQFTGSTTFEANAQLMANPGATIAFTGGGLTLGAGTTLNGTGAYEIGTDTSVLGNLGASQLNFTNGDFTGNNATLTSNAAWTGSGSFAGSWRIAAGTTLSVADTGNHYIRGTVNNLGTLDTEGHLYFEYASYKITNAGTLNLRGDIGLVNAYAGGSVVNTGTFAKVAGAGTSVVQGIHFTNNGGLIDAQTGTLQFSGGALQFNDGSRFTGAGKVVIASNANFAGRIDTANLVLAGASYDGAAAEVHGSTTVTAGALTGQWTFASDHQLTLSPGSGMYVRGNVTNAGTFAAGANLYFEYPSYVLNNTGSMTLQGGASIVNAYAGGSVNNAGTLTVAAGSGTSLIQGITTSITGAVNLDSGTLQFSGGSLSLASTATLQAAGGTTVVMGGSNS